MLQPRVDTPPQADRRSAQGSKWIRIEPVPASETDSSESQVVQPKADGRVAIAEEDYSYESYYSESATAQARQTGAQKQDSEPAKVSHSAAASLPNVKPDPPVKPEEDSRAGANYMACLYRGLRTCQTCMHRYVYDSASDRMEQGCAMLIIILGVTLPHCPAGDECKSTRESIQAWYQCSYFSVQDRLVQEDDPGCIQACPAGSLWFGTLDLGSATIVGTSHTLRIVVPGRRLRDQAVAKAGKVDVDAQDTLHDAPSRQNQTIGSKVLVGHQPRAATWWRSQAH